MNRRIAIMFAGCLLSAHAHANIVYNWITTQLDPLASSVSGRLEVTDLTWASGQLGNSADFGYRGISASTGGLVSLNVNAITFLGLVSSMSIVGVNCAEPGADLSYICASVGGTGLFDYGNGYAWSYSMVFGTNSLNINANVIRDANPNVRVLTNEVDQLVDYGQAGGSAQFPCQIPACRSSGYWAIDPATVSAVPLPDSLLLFTVGLAVIVPVSLRGKPLRGS